MSEKASKGGPSKGAGQAPGKSNTDLKPKKTAPHRQVIEDAAKFNQSEHIEASTVAPSNVDDYDGGKVVKRRASKYEEDIQMVQDLDRWG